MADGTGVGARALMVARVVVLGMTVALLAAATSAPSWAAPKLSVLYSFKGGNDGALVYGNLVAGPDGALYGTTNAGGGTGFGTVFKLTPPKHGSAWTETVLHVFNDDADGFRPEAGLIIDTDGNLYGTATQGGDLESCDSGCGVVFKLTAPAAPNGRWKYSVLYRLTYPGGANPFGGVVMDSAGALYGTTWQAGSGGMGAVFQLTPPAPGAANKRWKYSVLHAFSFFEGSEGAHPVGGLTIDSHGALYGVTEDRGNEDDCFGGCGTIFKLTPPKRGKVWAFEAIHAFQFAEGKLPYRVNLVLDSKGALYGTASDGGTGFGTLFQLVPPAAHQTAWTLNVLHTFAKKTGSAPLAGLLFGADGALYGTGSTGGSKGYGAIFKLAPKAHNTWQYTMLWEVTDQTQGVHPFAPLIADQAGALYTTMSGGGASGEGSVVKLVP